MSDNRHIHLEKALNNVPVNYPSNSFKKELWQKIEKKSSKSFTLGDLFSRLSDFFAYKPSYGGIFATVILVGGVMTFLTTVNVVSDPYIAVTPEERVELHLVNIENSLERILEMADLEVGVFSVNFILATALANENLSYEEKQRITMELQTIKSEMDNALMVVQYIDESENKKSLLLKIENTNRMIVEKLEELSNKVHEEEQENIPQEGGIIEEKEFVPFLSTIKETVNDSLENIEQTQEEIRVTDYELRIMKKKVETENLLSINKEKIGEVGNHELRIVNEEKIEQEQDILQKLEEKVLQDIIERRERREEREKKDIIENKIENVEVVEIEEVVDFVDRESENRYKETKKRIELTRNYIEEAEFEIQDILAEVMILVESKNINSDLISILPKDPILDVEKYQISLYEDLIGEIVDMQEKSIIYIYNADIFIESDVKYSMEFALESMYVMQDAVASAKKMRIQLREEGVVMQRDFVT